jgi:hypothetical protein
MEGIALAYWIIIDPPGHIVYRQDNYDIVFDYTLPDQILFAIKESPWVNKGLKYFSIHCNNPFKSCID